MKARPILFSPEMVRALVAGRKTQTRRVIRLQPDDRDQEVKFENGWLMYRRAGIGWCKDTPCPYGATGDLLWVRETCRAEELPRDGADYVRYFADDSLKLIDNTREAAERWHAMRHYRKKRGATVPPIHMPRWASRLTLRLTDVRVQRVQEITEDDAIAEGIPRAYPIAKVEFQDLWDDINAERGYPWPSNPWVWALSFEVIRANVDQVLKEAA